MMVSCIKNTQNKVENPRYRYSKAIKQDLK